MFHRGKGVPRCFYSRVMKMLEGFLILCFVIAVLFIFFFVGSIIVSAVIAALPYIIVILVILAILACLPR